VSFGIVFSIKTRGLNLLLRSITSQIVSEVYIPALQKLWPTGLEELHGIADGSELTLEDIVMLNARYDLARCLWRLAREDKQSREGNSFDFNGNINVTHDSSNGPDANECTSAFFAPESTESGDALAVQNWDMSNHLYDKDLIVYLEVHPDPSENRPSMFILTEAGQLIRTGMNSAGLAVTANSLLSTADYVPISHTDREGVYHKVAPKPVLPISLARRVFLEYSIYSEGLVAINSFPRHVSGNLHVSTADGFGMGLEVSPDRIYKFYGTVDDNYVLHTNHFVTPGFVGRDDVLDRYPGGSSWFRMQRAERGVRKYRNGMLTVNLIRHAFSDHLSYPESVCSHPNYQQKNTPDNALTGYASKLSMTVAFVVYNVTQRKVTVCKGPPCQGVLQEFHLDVKGQNILTKDSGK
jgi:isopenicillin-N N-acyltransferase-like protein